MVEPADRLGRADAKAGRNRAEPEQHRTGIDVHEGVVRVARRFREAGDPAGVLPKTFFVSGVPTAGDGGVEFGGEQEDARVSAAAGTLQDSARAGIGLKGGQPFRRLQRTVERGDQTFGQCIVASVFQPCAR